MRQHLYVGAGLAVKSVWNGPHNVIDNQIQSFTLLNVSRDEAYGWAMRYMKDHWPASAGYGSYEVSLTQISQADIENWLASVQATQGDGDGE